MKPPARSPVWVPTVQQMARFVLAEAAGPGALLDVDLNTGMLVHAPMADTISGQASVAATPPPGMYLRALAQGWAAHAMAVANETGTGDPLREGFLTGASEAWAGAARQLANVLDTIGVASLVVDDPPQHVRVRWASHIPIRAVDFYRCARCGLVLEAYASLDRSRAWVTEGGEVECEGPPPPNAGSPAEWVPRLVLEALLQAWTGQVERAGRGDVLPDDPSPRTLRTCADMLADVLAWRGEG